jgi:hypothetical protein
MKFLQNITFIALLFISIFGNAQETEDYFQFDDSKNVVHGVYLGINFNYGEIDGKSTYAIGGKIAYVANRQFEIGFSGMSFYSDQNNKGPLNNNDLFGGYGGLHLEPILFGKSKISLSFPVLVGGGAIGVYEEYDFIDWDPIYSHDWAAFFIVEPGISMQYNISRYVQFEIGVKYRVSSNFELYPGSIKNINGFSGGLGVKFGVFNMGRNK